MPFCTTMLLYDQSVRIRKQFKTECPEQSKVHTVAEQRPCLSKQQLLRNKGDLFPYWRPKSCCCLRPASPDNI